MRQVLELLEVKGTNQRPLKLREESAAHRSAPLGGVVRLGVVVPGWRVAQPLQQGAIVMGVPRQRRRFSLRRRNSRENCNSAKAASAAFLLFADKFGYNARDLTFT